MNYLTLEETKKVALDYMGKPELIKINEVFTKDFKWGSLFRFESANHEQIGNITGLPFILVDKIIGEVQPINYLKNVDAQLEKYRKKKGYKHVIKFPAKGDLNKMSTFEKVFALLRTEELIQIEEAIEIIKSNNLFSPKGLAEVCCRRKTNNIIESISNGINTISENYWLYESNLKAIPNEIALFKKEIRNLSISEGSIEIIPEAIKKMENLNFIKIEFAPLKSIPFDLSNLRKLKKLIIKHSKFSTQNKNKFIVSKDCEIIIS